MWALRDYRYGGLAKRYKTYSLGVTRCIDPIAQKPVAFGTELEYDNWLLHWANPAVASLVVRPPPLACRDHGKLIKVTPHLSVNWRSGATEVQLVVTRYALATERRAATLERVAQLHGCQCSIRTRREIRADLGWLDCWDHLRQCAEMHADEPLKALYELVRAELAPRGSLTRGQLVKRTSLVAATPSEVDAVLVRLHFQGLIVIHLGGRSFGPETQIEWVTTAE